MWAPFVRGPWECEYVDYDLQPKEKSLPNVGSIAHNPTSLTPIVTECVCSQNPAL